MRRFKNPEMRVTFTFPQPMANGVVDEIEGVTRTVHKFLCTSNPHFNSNLETVFSQNDPFQRNTHIPLDKVSAQL